MVKHRNLFIFERLAFCRQQPPFNIIIILIDYSATMFIIAGKCLMKQ